MKSAPQSRAWLLSGGLMVAVLAATAWLALVTGAIVWLLDGSASWPAALGIAALPPGCRHDRPVDAQSSTELPFAATLRQLKGDPAADGRKQ
jgi:uncharacterized RDD family membrane protein YckC